MAKVNKEGQVWQKVDKDYEDIQAGDFLQILYVDGSDALTRSDAEFGDIFEVSSVDSDGDLTLFGNDDYKTYVTHRDYNVRCFSVVELVEDSVPEVDTEEALTPCQKLGYKVGDKVVAKVMWDGVTEGKVYDVSKVIGDQYYFINDDGYEMMFDKSSVVEGLIGEAVSEDSSSTQASEILRTAMNHLIERGITYDAKGGERSMQKVVDMFNIYKGSNLSVEDGWMFMVLLKMVRCSQGDYKGDNYEDGSAYFALAGEEAAQERGGNDE